MPFKKGESGNPGKKFKKGNPGGGRPKKIPELDALMADILGEEKDGVTAAAAILKRLRQTATAGSGANNIRAAEVLLNRGYGMPKQTTDLTSKGESLNHPKELIYQTAPTNGLHPDSVTPEASNGS